MVLVDMFYHGVVLSLIVIGIYFVFSPEQAGLSTTAALVGGVYFNSVEVAYALLILTIPQLIVAIVLGCFIGAWITDD
jgi:hypothetical protein